MYIHTYIHTIYYERFPCRVVWPRLTQKKCVVPRHRYGSCLYYVRTYRICFVEC